MFTCLLAFTLGLTPGHGQPPAKPADKPAEKKSDQPPEKAAPTTVKKPDSDQPPPMKADKPATASTLDKESQSRVDELRKHLRVLAPKDNFRRKEVKTT